MATYDVTLRLADGRTWLTRVEGDDPFSAVWNAQSDLVKSGHAKLVAAPCPKCLDSGIERQPTFAVAPLGIERRVICLCEHGQDLVADRGPDRFTNTGEPEAEAEIFFEREGAEESVDGS